MIYKNTPQLKKWLENGYPQFAEQEEFDIDGGQYTSHWASLQSRPGPERPDAATFRCLTMDVPPTPKSVVPKSPEVSCRFEAQPPLLFDDASIRSDIALWGRRIVTLLAAIALILLVSGLAHAQNVNPAIVVATCGTPPAVYPAANSRAPQTVDTNGNLCSGVTVSAQVATAGLASSANQTNNSQTTQIVDAGGDAATVTGGKLDVNATVTPSVNQFVSTTTGGNGGQVAVVGAASDGTTATFSPVRVGGVDTNGLIQDFRTTPNGEVVVAIVGTGNIGTVAVFGAATGSGGPVLTAGLDSGVITQDINCGQSVIVGQSSSGTTELVPLQASKRIYICSYGLSVGATATTVQLIDSVTSSQGLGCSASTAQVGAAWAFIANQGIVRGAGKGVILRSRPGAALCITNTPASGEARVTGEISYTQFGMGDWAILPDLLALWWFKRRRCA